MYLINKNDKLIIDKIYIKYNHTYNIYNLCYYKKHNHKLLLVNHQNLKLKNYPLIIYKINFS